MLETSRVHTDCTHMPTPGMLHFTTAHGIQNCCKRISFNKSSNEQQLYRALNSFFYVRGANYSRFMLF